MNALRASLLFCVFSAIFYCLNATAEALPDPTRPPGSFGQPQDGGPTPGPVLQSVLISPTRRVAIISGKTLRVGDKFNDAQLVKISENEVVLRTGKNLEVLKLYPLLRKQASNSRAEGNPAGSGQQR
jgi:MSHA biogenesis protein MshK